MTEQCPSPVDAIIRATERLEELGVSKGILVMHAQELTRGYVAITRDTCPGQMLVVPAETQVKSANWLIGV